MDSKKITIISIAIFVLSLLVFVATIFIVVINPSANKSANTVKREATQNIDVGAISTQIGKSGRFYKVFVVLEVKGKNAPDIIKKRMPQIKDNVISTISYSDIADITSKEGMANLKEKIRENVNNIIESEDIVDVLFTESILQ